MEEKNQHQAQTPVQNQTHIVSVQPTQQPIAKEGLKLSQIISIIIGIYCLLNGIGEVIVSIILIFFVSPQLNKLQDTLNQTHQSNILSMVFMILLILSGFANVFYGIKILKKSNNLKPAIIFLVFSVITTGLFAFLAITTVINPIYKIGSDIGPDNSIPIESSTPSPIQTIGTLNWKTYESPTGYYQISYPPNYTVDIGEAVGVDGVITKQLDTYTEFISTTIPETNGNMRLYVVSVKSDYKTPQESASNAKCTAISNAKGNPYMLGGVTALIHENTPCGPNGFTEIDAIENGRAYSIGINGTVGYEKMKPIYNQILSTFKFTN